MRMLPSPVTCLVVGLGYCAVGCDICIYERDVTVIGLRFLVKQGKDSLSAGTCHDDSIHLHRELVDVAHELLASVEERNDDVDSHGKSGERDIRYSQYGHKTAAYGKKDINDIAYIADDRSQDIRIGVRLAAVFGKSVIKLVEFLCYFSFVVKYLNDFLAVHDLLDKAFSGSYSLLLPDKVFRRTCADLACGKHHGNDAGDHDKGKPDAVIEHGNEHGDNDNACPDDIGDCHRYELS